MTNKARPEGSIAEGYIANECLTFCSMYLEGIETRFNRDERNHDGGEREDNTRLSVFSQSLRPLGHMSRDTLLPKDLEMAHWYVLNNYKEVEPFLCKCAVCPFNLASYIIMLSYLTLDTFIR